MCDMDCRVRRPTEEDYERWHELYQGYADFVLCSARSPLGWSSRGCRIRIGKCSCEHRVARASSMSLQRL